MELKVKIINFFSKMYDSLKAAIQLWLARRSFYAFIIDSSSKGFLTSEERAQIEDRAKQLLLTFNDFGSTKKKAYRAALSNLQRQSEITKEMELNMDAIQGFLQIPFEEIEKEKTKLDRLRLITEVRYGNLPILHRCPIILQKNEIAYWSEPAELMEVRVIGRRYEGGSSGVSIRIMKGVSYRVGNHRGRMVTDKALLAVAQGQLIVTNKRLVFSGDAKSFDVKIEKILNINYTDDGILFTTANREKPYAARFKNLSDVEIVEEIIRAAIQRFAA
ncbi:hypothetical protein [Bdellovibrio sp. HCB-162]|uniref:hypothetical protein n=1 Tax=Bdellovibrio sp. HCB-162 TaxID=3394234 RepID=UPI0039BD6D3C